MLLVKLSRKGPYSSFPLLLSLRNPLVDLMSIEVPSKSLAPIRRGRGQRSTCKQRCRGFGQSTPAWSEAAITVFVAESHPSEGTTPEPSIPIVSDDMDTILYVDPSPTEPDFKPSTSTAAPELVELAATKPNSIESQVPIEEVETGAFLLNRNILPPPRWRDAE